MIQILERLLTHYKREKLFNVCKETVSFINYKMIKTILYVLDAKRIIYG